MKTNQFCVGIESLDPSVKDDNPYNAAVLNNLKEAMESLGVMYQAGKNVVAMESHVKARAFVEIAKEYNNVAKANGLKKYSAVALESHTTVDVALESVMEKVKNGIGAIAKKISDVANVVFSKIKSGAQSIRRGFTTNTAGVKRLSKIANNFGEESGPSSLNKSIFERAGFGYGQTNLGEVTASANACVLETAEFINRLVGGLREIHRNRDMFNLSERHDIFVKMLTAYPSEIFKGGKTSSGNSVTVTSSGGVVGKSVTVTYPKNFNGEADLFASFKMGVLQAQKVTFEPVTPKTSEINEFVNNFEKVYESVHHICVLLMDARDYFYFSDDNYDEEEDYEPDYDMHISLVHFIQQVIHPIPLEIFSMYKKYNDMTTAIVEYVEKSNDQR